MIEQYESFKRALPVLKRLEHAGYEAVFVGGAVRDAVLGKAISDVDIATSATPVEVKQLFSSTVDLGIEHGTVLVLYQGEGYEVTTYRTDGDYLDHRHPNSVTFVRTLAEDLKRRDFTMNALALNSQDQVIDYFDGMKDIKEQYIRSVGDAQERFQEDALRMFRAIRFSSQLGFTIDPETFKAIQNLAPLLEKVAVERIRVEWLKTLQGSSRQIGIQQLLDSGLYGYCPLFAEKRTQLENLAFNSYPHTYQTSQAWILLTYYLGYSAKDVEPFLRAWKCSNHEIQEVKIALEIIQRRKKGIWNFHMAYICPEELAVQIEELLPSLGIMDASDSRRDSYERLPIHSIKDLALNGIEVMQLLHLEKKGPKIGQTLHELEEAVLSEKVLNDKESLRQFIRKRQGSV